MRLAPKRRRPDPSFRLQRMSEKMGCHTESPGSGRDGLRAKWDSRYRESDRIPLPAQVLTDNCHLLPPQGRALDLACGLGANAIFLAERGLEVSAWDLSSVAVERLQRESERLGLRIDARARDWQAETPEPASFDVVVVAHFLDRNLADAITEALRPGGLLFYQTFTRESVTDCGPSNPQYRLAVNELLRLFPSLIVRFYREEGRVGDLTRGSRDIAMLVAQRSS
jgi:tellurite methyltransferase